MSAKVEVIYDPEREDWLAVSKAALRKTWDNEADDVFNELRPQ
jgi:hypothetical protein